MAARLRGARAGYAGLAVALLRAPAAGLAALWPAAAPAEAASAAAPRAASWMWLNACAAFSLKDAARRDRLGASTFRALAKGLLAAAALHIAVQGAAAAVAARGAPPRAGRRVRAFAPRRSGAGPRSCSSSRQPR